MFPGVKRFIDATTADGRRDGFVSTLAGRRRYLRDLRSADVAQRNTAERQAVNTVIQGTAADVLKKALVSLSKALPPPCRTCLTLHDEIIVLAPLALVETAAAILRDCMMRGFPETVTRGQIEMQVDVRVGRSLNELTPWQPPSAGPPDAGSPHRASAAATAAMPAVPAPSTMTWSTFPVATAAAAAAAAPLGGSAIQRRVSSAMPAGLAGGGGGGGGVLDNVRSTVPPRGPSLSEMMAKEANDDTW